ncbi:hypothetical protein ANOM_010979 [Aspergillus nomiae NRRL 13137]|uniref:Galactose oxidase n=1 Tax=Aspergillus nomiae NRRL (strain ATCC 15546 / NRRL 13137 / CBS 260.88 / M93) TaxID=1509407 RepID=A0A0L1IME1_ASPN3|nr:uncharacterized protein ANOM_010979 [Aspergillus nomiae NRRL 13137]KNG80754.1 hypothetical protein ANOM_010979 [Aspergillus nomiae NRRL 13137]
MNTFITLLVVLFLGCRVSAIPYTPSHLLYSAQYNGSIAYLLRPSDSNTTEFLSLNISKDIDSANPQYTSLLDDAPFQLYKQNLALVPAIDQHGILKVYAGDCHNTSGYGALWQFTPDAASSTGNGTWERIEVNGTGQSNVNPHGPNYLAAGFTYASTNTTNSSFYVFGGMCPLASASEATWITAANYSQSMIALEPPKTDSLTSYRISATGDRAPPIPEAGFTITPLQATYRSTSSGTLLQQQDFLMIGGQTQNAFINMSQVAVFSLPQSSWSFVTIDSTLSLSRTELAIRDPSVVEPRSGHTAVLSPDGSKVVVFGGWVGSTSVPANPQLAILELAADSIGSTEWAWKIPPTGDAGIAEGTGIYGHGATMLPGGVMMITGGYHISQSSKRSITATEVNSKTLMYNVTSGKWVSSYSNPGPSPDGGSGSSVSRRAGLGVGLGLGIPFVAGAAAVFLWFYFRRRRVRRTRNQMLRELSLGTERSIFWSPEESHLTCGTHRPSEIMAERTGLLRETSCSIENKRLSLNARMYQPPSQCNNEYMRGDGTGDMHPIDEEDEAHGAAGGDSTICKAAHHRSTVLLPKTTPTEPSPEGVTAFATSVGRANERQPSEHDDRTSSNLSGSSKSAAQQSHGIMDNHPSQPSSGRESPEKSSSASNRSRDTWSRPNSTVISHERRSSDSFSTAHTTISQRQAEGEHLLRNDPEPSSPIDLIPRPLSISKPRAEWIGNVRRVLSMTRKRPQSSEDGSVASTASGIDRRSAVLGPAGSLLDYKTESKLPRRSVSASAELFRRKQGAKDWGAGNIVSRELTGRMTRDDFGLDGVLDLDDDDWDVEGAAENRRVQVTFTVPKEKLRVVNATANDMDNISEASISRSDSRT